MQRLLLFCHVCIDCQSRNLPPEIQLYSGVVHCVVLCSVHPLPHPAWTGSSSLSNVQLKTRSSEGHQWRSYASCNDQSHNMHIRRVSVSVSVGTHRRNLLLLQYTNCTVYMSSIHPSYQSAVPAVVGCGAGMLTDGHCSHLFQCVYVAHILAT